MRIDELKEQSVVPALEVRGLSKTFGANYALRSLDLTIETGEIHCLVGENGSGKSTLIKILSGYHTPDRGGEIRIGGRQLDHWPSAAHHLGCRFVHQDLGLILNLSALDNLCLGSGYPTRAGTIRQRASRDQAKSDLHRLGLRFDPDTLVEKLSPAERTGVAISRALREEVGNPIHLLVLDEPTATLPVDDVRRLLDLVREIARSGVSVLYVTHRLEEVFEIGDRVSVLRDGQLTRTAKVADITRDQVVTELTGHPAVHAEPVTADSRGRSNGDGRPLLLIERLAAPALGPLTFEVHAGEIVGVAGITGSGRETLLSTIFGARPRRAGTVTLGGQDLRFGRPDLAIASGLAFLPADRKAHGSVQELTGRENLVLIDVKRHWNHVAISRRQERQEAAGWFKRLDVRPVDALEQQLSSFSGGNQQKILLGKWLRRKPKVFLLDEPTQGVDIGARERVHSLLRLAAADGMGIVVSSSDVLELASLCDRVLILSDGWIATTVFGPITDDKGLSRAILTASNNDRSAAHA